jgi:hypothetical protein
MRYLIVTLLLVSLLHAKSQELTYKQFTVKDGLPGSVVYQALQDKNGFIWFATSQGVSRFDGRTFKNFTKEDGLPDNDIIKLYLDKFNNVWFLSFMGVPAVYHNSTIKRFDRCKGVMQITEDPLTDSIIFLAETFQGKNAFIGRYTAANVSGKWQFTAFFKDLLLHAPNNRPVLRASSPEKINFYFSHKDSQAYTLHVKTANTNKSFPVKRTDVFMSPFEKSSFSCLTSDKKGIVFCISDTIYYASANTMTPVTTLKAINVNTAHDVSSFFCENDSTLWISTRNRGLISIKNFLSHNLRVQTYFTKSFCTSLLKDHENGYWITTQGEGVYYLPNLCFYTLSRHPDMINKNALCIVNGHASSIAAGFASGNFFEINYNNLRVQQFANWFNKNKNNRILHLQPLQQENVFLIACDNGLYRVSPRAITHLAPSAAKEIYLSPHAGFYVGANDALHSFTSAGKETNFFFRGRVTCLTGSDGCIYWGTLHGLYSYINGEVRFIGAKYPVLAGIINHLDVAPDSSLWISTQQGIIIMKGAAITGIKKENGLLSNMCKHVSFNNNTAWVATDKGISRINYSRLITGLHYSISNITEEDGLATNEVNQTVAAGNYIWAATAKGICYFSKDYISRSVVHPLVNINRIMANGKVLPITDSVHMHHSTGKLLIELSAISYGSGKQVQYEYRLNGLDSGWNTTGNSVIEFPALPFGRFVFEARAVDRWGAKSEHPVRIVVMHPPPFTKTTWFLVLTYIMLTVLLGAGFFVYYRRRQKKREQEYALKRKVHELEMMALSAQMNPHFIFNCLTSIQYHILQADMRSANTYLHKFSTLIRQTLQHSTDSLIPLREEIKLLSLYLELEKLRLGDRMDYQLTVSEDVNADDLSIPPMIVQPFIENAVKHGIPTLQHRKGVLTVQVTRNDHYIECMIEDNGPGIYSSRGQEHDSEYTSMGTGITSRRIEAINAIQKNKIQWRVTDKQQAGLPGSGTIIHLSFPIIPS